MARTVTRTERAPTGQSDVARSVTRTERAPMGQSDVARTVTRTERAPTAQSDVARTVARTDGPMRRGAHRGAHRRGLEVEAWRATSAANRIVVFVETRNRREGIGNSKETNADNNLYYC